MLDINAADLNPAHEGKRDCHKMAAFRVEASDECLAEPRLEAINRFPGLEISDVARLSNSPHRWRS
jgi:hypothetical protein